MAPLRLAALVWVCLLIGGLGFLRHLDQACLVFPRFHVQEDAQNIRPTHNAHSGEVDPKPLPTAFNSSELDFSVNRFNLVRRCTPAEAVALGKRARSVRISGCSRAEDFLYRIIHLHHPQGGVFVDIGCNRGYESSHFFALWDPLMGITAQRLQLALGTSDCGYCKDCQEVTTPFISDFLNRKYRFRPRLSVLSFDGNARYVSKLTNGINTLKNMLSGNFSAASELPNMWKAETAAFTEEFVPGATVRFVNKEEHGHLAADGEAGSADVPTLTIDRLFERNGLESAVMVKIDTEGHDYFVLRGGRSALRNHKILGIKFEYNNVWPRQILLKVAVTELEEMGYVCFLEGVAGLIRLNFGCWNDAYESRQFSNAWCFSSRWRQGLAIIVALDNLVLGWNSL